MNAVASWPGKAESWLDAGGTAAWVGAMVLGFIVFWPIGLAILGYMLWTRRMSGRCGAPRRPVAGGAASSGNAAFDAYKAETLRRLEDEQKSFEAFLERLREARDKSEFDQFMEEREKGAGSAEAPGVRNG